MQPLSLRGRLLWNPEIYSRHERESASASTSRHQNLEIERIESLASTPAETSTDLDLGLGDVPISNPTQHNTTQHNKQTNKPQQHIHPTNSF